MFNANQVSYGAMETAPTNPFNQQQQATGNMFNNQMPPQQQQSMPNPQNPFNNPAAAMASGPSPANPFANPNAYATQPEQVQPYPTDPYMHGNSDQRGFNNY